jgi:hypothetical protein
MHATLIRRIAALNWLIASVFVLANDELNGSTVGAIAVMAVLAAFAFVAASLVASAHRPAALTAATVLVLACLGILSVGLLMLPTGLVTFGAVAAAIAQAAGRRRADAAA